MEKSDFRILEYKEHFEVQQKSITSIKLFGVVIQRKTQWHYVYQTNPNKLMPDIRKFNTKQEAIDFIEEKVKYPIYHSIKD